MSAKTTYVIDASAFIFRAYFALAPLSSKGRPSHALTGFASMLLKLLRDHAAESCIVVFDSKKPTFRKEIYPDYKANRDAPPPDISDQIAAAMQMCKLANLKVLQGEGFEADDYIASFVKQSDKNQKVVIVSSDKDLMQLVDRRVEMFDSFKNKTTGIKQVEEKWGVKPELVRDLLALTGDTSDNIPGVQGVGPKTAAKLLNEYGSIEEIYKNLDKLPAKQREKFEAAKGHIKLSQQLVSLKEDLDIGDVGNGDFKLPLPKKLRDFLIDWDCNRILSQYADLLGDSESGVQVTGSQATSSLSLKLVSNADELQSLENQLFDKKLFCFDCETSSFTREKAKVVGVAFACEPLEAFYVPWRHGDTQLSETAVRKFLLRVLADKSLSRLAHNAKYDIQVLTKDKIPVTTPIHDTMILGHLLYADRRSFSLDNLAKDFLAQEKGDLKKLLNGSEDFSSVDLNDAVKYAAKDAALTLQLFHLFYPEIQKNKELLALYEHVEQPLVQVLADMEMRGVEVDREYLQELSIEMHERLDKIEKKIYKSAGSEFNISSPKQLQKILFEDLNLTPSKKTKTGFSTNESVLMDLQLQHELPALILDYRKLAKLTSTYVDVLPELTAEDGRIHTNYHQTGTATGRLSSSEPNLQNIPARSEEGQKIRAAFVPQEGFVFLSADYSQVELRLMAHFSGDQKMIAAFQEGRDIHSETAKIIFGSDDKEHRSKAKAINFGIIYGISAYGLSQQLKISRADAKDFIESYFDKFPSVQKYMEDCVALAQKHGYTKTLFGRVRPLPDINSKNFTLRQNAERIAINAPLQGTAADIMKQAMVQVDEKLKAAHVKSQMLLQVHDELVLEVKRSELKQVTELLVSGMKDLSGTPAEKLKVPLEVDSSSGANWAEL